MAQAPTFPQSESSGRDAGSDREAGPPIRIRHLLALALVGGAGWWAYPRMVAAWNVHDLATNLANYALCMAGPTAPSLLRDNPPEFNKLVRRRLVAAGPSERPFEACAELAREVTGSEEAERAHLAAAHSFVEYGTPGASPASAPPVAAGEGDAAPADAGSDRRTLASLAVTTRSLARMAKAAWPFVQGGYTRLVVPSSTARGAPHPVAPPRPAVGQGLPAWRPAYRATLQRGPQSWVLAVGRDANLTVHSTEDDGVNWRPARVDDASVQSFAERCTGNEHRQYTLGVSDAGDFLTVTSHGPQDTAFVSAAAPASRRVVAAACDERALVLATRPERGRDVTLALCRFRQSCTPMALPELRGTGVLPSFPLDLARVDGTTVLVWPMRDIVRITSTRDDGASWTPFSVAFDRHEYPELRTNVALPTRVLSLGKRLLLYAGSPKPGMSYPVLASDDLGASWKAP